MSKSSPLRVKRVKRYHLARYPSHRDPDPTTYPQPVPYPASWKWVAALASAGLAATAGCNGPSAAGSSPNAASSAAPGNGSEGTVATSATASATNVKRNAADNPFSIAVSGLPYRTSGYGTGVPSWIDSDLARRVIERTFKQQEVSLQPGYEVKDEEVQMVATGYNKDEKLGYVFVDWDNLDVDALIQWSMPKNVLEGKLEAKVAYLKQQSVRLPNGQALVAEIAAAENLPDPARRKAALQQVLADVSSKLVSMKEAQELEKRAVDGEQLIAVIRQYERRIAVDGWSV